MAPSQAIRLPEKGHDSATGYLKFVSPCADTRSWVTRDPLGNGYKDIKVAATLALGLTEQCAKINRGKVFYYPKRFYPSDMTTHGTCPDPNIQLPNLLYTDYVWGHAERDEWLSSPQQQRLHLLNARGGFLHVATHTMPIMLTSEVHGNAEEVRFDEVLGNTILYYNNPGEMYIGFAEELIQHGTLVQGEENQTEHIIVPKNAIAMYQARTGEQAAQMLREMYLRCVPSTLFSYSAILKVSIEAHNKWVATGGYTIEDGASLGKEGVAKVEKINKERGVVEAGQLLMHLRAEIRGWSEAHKKAAQDYSTAAGKGVIAVSEYLTQDQNWETLTREQKQKVVNLWRLSVESGNQAAAT